jgi:predicted  nucleic acid-binding Zn-ribbon protein
MAVSERCDFDELAVRLIQLERREAEIERRLTRLQDRHGQFPNEMSGRQLNELNTEHIRVRQQITTIRAQLVPIMRVPAR